MKRKLLNKMLEWKSTNEEAYNGGEKTAVCKPLLIYGIKGTGKTHLAMEFAKNFYEGNLYINFENSADICREFLENPLEADFLKIISRFYQIPLLLMSNILIILDEIKRFEPAYNSFCSFCKENKDKISNIVVLSSNIVNKTDNELFEILYLKPMDFEEFLIANGNEWYTDIIKAHSQNFRKIPEIVHNELSSLFEDYIITGGMPAAVNEYFMLENTYNINEIHHIIFNNILADFDNICNETEVFKCRQLLNITAPQLTKSNKKFQYKQIRKGATGNMFKKSLNTLTEGQYVYKCPRISAKESKELIEEKSVYKLYLWDTGILYSLFSSNKEFNFKINIELKKTIIENYVVSVFNNLDIATNFWESDSAARVDCVIKQNDIYIPVDIKIKEKHRSKSAGIFKNTYLSPYILKVTDDNFDMNNEIKSIPYYALYAFNKNII